MANPPFDRMAPASRSWPYGPGVWRLYDTVDANVTNRTPAEFTEALGRVPIATDAARVERHNALSMGQNAVMRNLALNVTDAIKSAAFEFAQPADTRPPIDFPLREAVAQYDQQYYVADKLGYFIDVVENAHKSAKYACKKLVEQQLIFGDPDNNPEDLSGIDHKIDSLGLGTTAATTANILRDLDALRQRVTALDGGEVPGAIYLCNGDAINKIEDAYRAGGAGQTPMGECPDGRWRSFHNGVPIYRSDFIPTDAALKTTNIYCLLCHPEVGNFIVVNEDHPDVEVRETMGDNSPFTSYIATWNLNFVNTTDRALARQTAVSVAIP